MENTSDRPDEKDKVSENLQTDALHKMNFKIWVSQAGSNDRFNPSPWEVKTGGRGDQGQPWVQ